jgi:cytochrome c biogenesis protein CcmG/thiol:disulfide interchange protein DsbE
MKRSLWFLLPAGLFMALVAFLFFGLYNDPREIPSPLIGKPAPTFSLETLADPSRTVSTADYQGRPYLVNVWGTWCPECRREHEVLLSIARTKIVPIVGLNWRDDRALAQRWLLQLGNPYYSVAFDPEGQAAIDWGVYGAPETFLVSADGTVLFKRIGPMNLDVWQREFLPLINGAGGPS